MVIICRAQINGPMREKTPGWLSFALLRVLVCVPVFVVRHGRKALTRAGLGRLHCSSREGGVRVHRFSTPARLGCRLPASTTRHLQAETARAFTAQHRPSLLGCTPVDMEHWAGAVIMAKAEMLSPGTPPGFHLFWQLRSRPLGRLATQRRGPLAHPPSAQSTQGDRGVRLL